MNHHHHLSTRPAPIFRERTDTADEQAAESFAHHRSDNRAIQIESPQRREIAFDGTLRINGYVAGLIRSEEGNVIVEAGGEVDADIFVQTATIYGCVRGDIRATQYVELCGSARVIGDLETQNLSIAPGAVFEGRCIFLQTHDAADSDTNAEEPELALAAAR